MFRSASLNTQPIPDDRPPEHRGLILVVPWCWPAGARVLLAIVALAAGLGLGFASWDAPSERPTGSVPDLVLDVNTAPEPVLAALPHVGPALVRRLVEARNQRPFRSLDDLDDRVRGVGPVTLARLKPYLRFEFEEASGVRPEPSDGSRRKTTRARKPTTATIPAPLTAMARSAPSRRITSPAR